MISWPQLEYVLIVEHYSVFLIINFKQLVYKQLAKKLLSIKKLRYYSKFCSITYYEGIKGISSKFEMSSDITNFSLQMLMLTNFLNTALLLRDRTWVRWEGLTYYMKTYRETSCLISFLVEINKLYTNILFTYFNNIKKPKMNFFVTFFLFKFHNSKI